MEILFSIIGSVIATFILSVIGFLRKWIPFRFFAPVTDVGVEKIFKNQKSAIPSIIKDLEKSKFIRVLAMKGETFSKPNKDENPFYDIICTKNIEQKYLVSSINNPYLEKRGEELGDIENMESCVILSVRNFLSIQKKHNDEIFKIRLHEEVVRFRIILLENYLYLSFQEIGKTGKSTSILKIKKGSPMYVNFSSLFDDLWERYKNKEVNKLTINSLLSKPNR